MKFRTVAIVIVSILLLIVAGYAYRSHLARTAFPPRENVCFNMLIETLQTARTTDGIIVPTFALSAVTSVRCRTAPGFVTYEIAGTDVSGADFHIYQTSGGKAASGGDSVFDYCYTRDGDVVSQTRITGRDGNKSDSVCTYDPAFLSEPSYSYEYDVR